jgi:hypothetical protein
MPKKMPDRNQKMISQSLSRARSLKKKAAKSLEYPIGPHGRMGHEGFLAGIGGWSGDLTKKATWLAPATGTARNRPIEDLIDWLNANVKTEQGKRLRAFIHDLKQIESLSQPFDFVIAQRFAPLVIRRAEGEPEAIQTIRRIHARVQKTCKYYCLYPRLTWTLWQKDWGLDFCTEAHSNEIPVTYNGASDYGRRVFEGDAAIVVIGITQRGEILRLRACEHCGSWFFASANTSHNARKFCKEACRLKHFHNQRRIERIKRIKR